MYEIVIGGWLNSHSGIRKGALTENQVTAATPDICNYDEYQKYRITVNAGTISVYNFSSEE